MSFARAIFVFALFTPILGATGSKFVVSAILGQSPQTVVAPAAQVAVVSTPAMVAISTPLPATPRPSSTPTPLTALTPLPTVTAAASPTTATTTLTKYWLDQTEAHAGDTITVRYDIENGTGQPMYIGLGISMKSSSAASWSSAFIDAAHDVTAAVPPGSSTHTRYFTLPDHLAPGDYDVAWGLKDSSGTQIDVASSSGALRIVK